MISVRGKWNGVISQFTLQWFPETQIKSEFLRLFQKTCDFCCCCCYLISCPPQQPSHSSHTELRLAHPTCTTSLILKVKYPPTILSKMQMSPLPCKLLKGFPRLPRTLLVGPSLLCAPTALWPYSSSTFWSTVINYFMGPSLPQYISVFQNMYYFTFVGLKNNLGPKDQVLKKRIN